MKFQIKPSIVFFLIGLTGLLFTFADKSGGTLDRIPPTILFIFIMCLGILLEILPNEYLDDVVGEVEGPRSFG